MEGDAMRSSTAARRPSPGLIVAALALTVALGGTAVAADPAAKISKSKVKTIARKQIDKLAPELDVASAKQADKADTAKQADEAGTAEKALNVFGVSANSSGDVTDSTIEGATVVKTGNSYKWTFPRNVVDCVPVASGIFSDGFVALQAGTAPNNTNSVIVNYFEATGDHNLIVVCP
jgi:hypothetical protein